MIRKNIKALIRTSKVAAIGAWAAVANDILDGEEKQNIDKILLNYFQEQFPLAGEWGTAYGLHRKCHDCKEYGYGYMLQDCVWYEALEVNKDDDEIVNYLCLWCVDKRLGRPVNLDDLSEAPINDPLRYILNLSRPERDT